LAGTRELYEKSIVEKEANVSDSGAALRYTDGE
jgi:hypothetical protein